MMNEKKPEEEFEEGKQMEEYSDSALVDELNGLKIEEEPNPESEQRLETVVESPIKNEKKKPLPPPPKKDEPKPIQPVQQSKEVKANVPVVNIPEAKPEVKPTPVPKEELPQQPQPVFTGIDDYIQKTGLQIEENYVLAGREKRKEFVNGAYNNLLGVISGEYVIVPRQAVQPATQPESTPQAVHVQPRLSTEELKAIVKEVVAEAIPKEISPPAPLPVEPKVGKITKWGALKVLGLTVSFFLVGLAIVLISYAVTHH